VAAQMLSGNGFGKVINLAGGIQAWNGKKAFFGEEKGIELFTGKESLEQTLVVAYAMEEGLREFYLSMVGKVENKAVKDMFQKLSQIETKHQERIFQQYIQISKAEVSRKKFEADLVVPAVEGGMTTEEYVNFFSPDWESVQGIIELAMSIEAQALDLYFRASKRTENKESKNFLCQIADEEQAHLQQLGKLMDSVISKKI
jgi:rubrerythrin